MILSKKAIASAMEQGALIITGFPESIKPSIEKAHVNLHIDTGKDSVLQIEPKGFVIATTLEVITLNEQLFGLVEGRASHAKKGLSVEQSSTFVEPGTDNAITLELFNASDSTISLQSGEPIAKLALLKVVDEF